MTQIVTNPAITQITNGLDPVTELASLANATAQVNATLGANTVATVANNANQTLTASTILSGFINRTGNANNALLNITDTTDTAANICAAIQSAAPGINLTTTAMRVRYLNNNTSNIATLAAGSGVTITGGATPATIGNSNWKDYLVTFGANANVVTMTNIGGGTLNN